MHTLNSFDPADSPVPRATLAQGQDAQQGEDVRVRRRRDNDA